jgi:alpha-glucoside transport system permease protein
MPGKKRNRRFGAWLINGALILLVIIWSIPTLGLFISSFRTRFDIQTSGWWNVFPHREWETVATINPQELGLDPTGVMTVEGVTGTFEEMREGLASPTGDTRVVWVGNRRLGRIEVQEQVWTVTWDFTLDNYRQVLSSEPMEVTRPDGTVEEVPSQNMTAALLNSLTVAVPSTIIPILIAAFAAYAFAWMRFPGRKHRTPGGAAADRPGSDPERLQHPGHQR